MSSDYRPRGGGSGGSSGGGRRRRGGRNRGGRSFSGEQRGPSHSHGNGASHSHPEKKQNLFAKLFGWVTGKNKKKPEPRQFSSPRVSAPRPEFRDKEPRAERPRREDRPPRPEPTPQEITSPKLYVGNLSYDAAESDLFDLFSKVGAVKNVEVAQDRQSARSKGFGFVEMETLETAKEAAAKLNRTDFMGRQIVVSGAKLEKRSLPAPRETEGGSEEESNI